MSGVAKPESNHPVKGSRPAKRDSSTLVTVPLTEPFR